jgi:hypothetical protein
MAEWQNGRMVERTKKMISCNIIKDILPLYIDGLVSDPTKAEISTHLEGCPDCIAEHRSMLSSAVALPVFDKQAKELNYMKKVSRSRKWIRNSLISVTALLIAVLSFIVVFAVIYTYGLKVSSKEMTYELSFEENYENSGDDLYVIDMYLTGDGYFAGEVIPFKDTFTTGTFKQINIEGSGNGFKAECTPRKIPKWILRSLKPNPTRVEGEVSEGVDDSDIGMGGFVTLDRTGNIGPMSLGYGIRFFDFANKRTTVSMTQEDMDLASNDFCFIIHCSDKDILITRAELENTRQ